jgi:hypothetical protein
MDIRFSRKTCEPGEKVEVTGTIRTDTKPGKFKYWLRIFEAHPSEAVHTLDLTGQVEAQIQLSSEAVTLCPDFGGDKDSEQVSVVLHNKSEEIVRFQVPVSLPEGIEISLDSDQLKPNEQTQILLSASSKLLTDEDLELRIPTTHSVQSHVSIKVMVRPQDGIRVAPQAIRLGVATREHLLNRGAFTINLVGRSLERVDSKKVHTPPYLRLLQEQSVASDALRLHFGFVDGFAGLDLKSEIIIDLVLQAPKPKVERQYTIRIPISGILNHQ